MDIYYKIVFRGFKESVPAKEAMNRLDRLFELPSETIRERFSKTGCVVESGLALEDAVYLQRRIEAEGAVCVVEPEPARADQGGENPQNKMEQTPAAITNCRVCDGKVSSEAATCPHCGVSQPAKRASSVTTNVVNKKISPGRIAVVVVASLMALQVYSGVSEWLEKRSAMGSTNASSSSVPAPTPAQNSLQHCFNHGHAIATVYLGNIKQAMEVDMLASDMMDKGCQQAVGGEGSACVAECRLGFQVKTKQWLKN